MVLQPNLIPQYTHIHRLVVYQISGQLDNALRFMTTFAVWQKKKKKLTRKKNEETQPIFEGSYLDMI